MTLASVEAFISERRRKMRFPSWLEVEFERDNWDRRSKIIRLVAFRTAVVYNVFLLNDWFVVRDGFGVALALHFLVVTPWMLLVGWLAPRSRSKVPRECALMSIPIAIVLQILTVFCVTKSPHAAHYLYFVLITTIVANSALRLQYHYALFSSLTIFMLFVAVLMNTHHMPWEVAFTHCITFAISALLTLNSNRIMERDQRRFYLHALRDRLSAQENFAKANSDALTSLGKSSPAGSAGGGNMGRRRRAMLADFRHYFRHRSFQALQRSLWPRRRRLLHQARRRLRAGGVARSRRSRHPLRRRGVPAVAAENHVERRRPGRRALAARHRRARHSA